MKKLLSLIVIAAMLMCGAAAFAENEVNICGEWYVSYVVTSEGVLSAPGDAGFFQTFTINDDGSCSFGMSVFTCNSTSADGTWEVNDDGRYEMEFSEEVRFLADFIGDMLVICASDGSIYYCSADINDAQRVLMFPGYCSDAADEDFFGDWVCGAVLYTGESGNYEYYSRHILGLDFAVSIGVDTSDMGGYYANWHIGGVGAQVYNEDVQAHVVYELDEAGDAYMYSMFTLSNGTNTTPYMFLDSDKQTMHVYGIYGILVFTRADAPLERPAVIEEVYAQAAEQ